MSFDSKLIKYPDISSTGLLIFSEGLIFKYAPELRLRIQHTALKLIGKHQFHTYLITCKDRRPYHSRAGFSLNSSRI